MTEGKPHRLILSLSLPLMLGNVFQQLYTVTDAAVVGMLGLDALAALGAVDWFSWMMLSCVQGLTQGFCVRMAREYGASDHEALKRTVGNACALAAVCAVALTALGMWAINPVLRALRTPEDIVGMSQSYIRIIFLGTPAIMAFNLFSAMLRAVGDGKTPLKAMIIASLINVALDLAFVLGLDMGVEGAALATVIAQVCSVIWCLQNLLRRGMLRLEREDLRPDARLWGNLLALGTPVAMQNMAISVGGMIVQRVVNGFEVAFIAGFTAANKLYGVLEIAATSFGYAMTAYVGQNLGARLYGRIQSGVRTGAVVGVLTSLAICGGMLLFGRQLVSGFITSVDAAQAARALDYAWDYLWLMSVCLPVLYLLHIYRASLQGLGDTLFPMLSGVAELMMRVSVALFLTAKLGCEAVFLGEVLAWLGADVILFPSYFARIRRLRAHDVSAA